MRAVITGLTCFAVLCLLLAFYTYVNDTDGAVHDVACFGRIDAVTWYC